MKQPCKECPYRIDSAKGYLGESSYNPEEFLFQLELPNVHPCHKAIDWDDKTNININEAPICIGALQFMNNSAKRHRNPEIEKHQKKAGKNAKVLSYRHNFINHHSK